MTPATWWLGRTAGVLIVVSLALWLDVLLGNEQSLVRRCIHMYLVALDRKLRFIRSRVRPAHLLATQTILCAIAVSIAIWQRDLLWGLPLSACVAGPWAFLNKAAEKRVSRIEAQVEPWTNAVANALKASPSLGEAICSTTTLVPNPMSQELDVLVREYELGTPLDDALENLSERIQSRTLAGTVLALKIARRSGGNLTEMLESAAASLREFARLDGVVRTKTAEGKAQAFVIGLIPAPMVLGIRATDPRFFEPLFHSFLGQLIVAGAAALWVMAIVAARKILDVDV